MAGCERLVYSANLSTGLFKVRWFLFEGFSHARSVLQGYHFFDRILFSDAGWHHLKSPQFQSGILRWCREVHARFCASEFLPIAYRRMELLCDDLIANGCRSNML